MATMVDVARRAGVSQTTVSRVLNDPNSAAFSDETRVRVQSAMEELGYRPHLGAQSLKNRKSSQVGVLLENRPDTRFTHPLSWEFLLGINEGLESSGYIMSLVRLTDVAKDGGLQARALRSQFLDGVIVVNYLPPEIEGKRGNSAS
jgi:DNA-binding LacI/PurR family transcriptional regulator